MCGGFGSFGIMYISCYVAWNVITGLLDVTEGRRLRMLFNIAKFFGLVFAIDFLCKADPGIAGPVIVFGTLITTVILVIKLESGKKI